MNLIYLPKGINQFPTDELIEKCVNELKNKENSYLILEKDELTYVQILSTERGFVVQFQEGSVRSYFEFDIYMSRPKTIELLKSYARMNEEWCSNHAYHKVNVQGFWGALGYKVGRFYGSLFK